MMQTPYAGMLRVTAAIYQADRADLAQLHRAEQALRDQLQQLVADHARLQDRAAAPPDAARLAGSDARWQTWIASRQAELNAELARTLARKAAQIEKMRVSFGRRAAVEALCDQAQAKRRQDKIRRAAW